MLAVIFAERQNEDIIICNSIFSASVYADTASKMNFDEILTRSAQGDAEAQARLGKHT